MSFTKMAVAGLALSATGAGLAGAWSGLGEPSIEALRATLNLSGAHAAATPVRYVAGGFTPVDESGACLETTPSHEASFEIAPETRLHAEADVSPPMAPAAPPPTVAAPPAPTPAIGRTADAPAPPRPAAVAPPPKPPAPPAPPPVRTADLESDVDTDLSIEESSALAHAQMASASAIANAWAATESARMERIARQAERVETLCAQVEAKGAIAAARCEKAALAIGLEVAAQIGTAFAPAREAPRADPTAKLKS
jgi:hypothetical protein